MNAAYEPIVPLRILDLEGQHRDIEAVVDTGFTGFLALPVDLVVELRLPFLQTNEAALANGDELSFNVHHATVLWDGQLRNIEAYAMGNTPLVGMLLLDNHNLNIDIERGGRVLIQPLALTPTTPTAPNPRPHE